MQFSVEQVSGMGGVPRLRIQARHGIMDASPHEAMEMAKKLLTAAAIAGERPLSRADQIRLDTILEKYQP